MRPIRWLHLSDFHLRENTEWQQNVVLKSLCISVEELRKQGKKIDFILVTGDIAFSGKEIEYNYAEEFFDSLCKSASLSKDLIFCVPGNHDIDRSRQKYCFMGVQKELESPGMIDIFLNKGEDLDTLLLRQSNFRAFQNRYFSNQTRTYTSYGLGYTSFLTIADVNIAIIGLDSSWLAHGGDEDQGKLITGEKQVIDAFRQVKEAEEAIHIIVSMTHHPLHHMREFDRRSVENKLVEESHFHHCGHLHEPETKTIRKDKSECHFISAGASFETRHSTNSYSIVEIDILNSSMNASLVKYSSLNGRFDLIKSDTSGFTISNPINCSLQELSKAIENVFPKILWPNYLSSILLDIKNEIIVQAAQGYIWGTLEFSRDNPKNALSDSTQSFVKLKNILGLLYTKFSLEDIFRRYPDLISNYADKLNELSVASRDLRLRLDAIEQEALSFYSADKKSSHHHTIELLKQLAEEQEWSLLLSQSERHIDSADSELSVIARRLYAMAQCKTEESSGKKIALNIYNALIKEEVAIEQDVINLCSLMFDAGELEIAKSIILASINKFPVESADTFLSFGRELAMASGDRSFRKTLEETIRARINQ